METMSHGNCRWLPLFPWFRPLQGVFNQASEENGRAEKVEHAWPECAILSVDVGGSRMKVMTNVKKPRCEFVSGRDLSARVTVKKVTRDRPGHNAPEPPQDKLK
jgi:hypothetical protein